MNIQPPLKSNSQPAKARKPRVPFQPLAALHPFARNAADDAPRLQIGPTTARVIPLVDMQFLGSLARSATQTS